MPRGERSRWPARPGPGADPGGPGSAQPRSAGGTQPGNAGSAQPAGAAGAARAPSGGAQAAPRLTSRGAVVVMFGFFFGGILAAGWLHAELLAGLTFAAGCALAAWYSRRDAMLAVVVSPPLVFMVALVAAELLISHGDSLHHTVTSAAEGTVLTLAAVAPWLFGGVVICVVIAMFRGLPQCIRSLRMELRGDLGFRGPAGREPTAPPTQRAAYGRRDPR